MNKTRLFPNILITGTPGCGKTTTCELLNRSLESYSYYNITDFAKDHNCYESYDEERKSYIVDEEKLLDELEPLLCKGAAIIDWHVNDIFPERLIDLVVVLRCDNSMLFDRLSKRGYHESKIEENLDAEIMGVVMQDALESYEKELVVELQSNTIDQMEENTERIIKWQKDWLEQHKKGVTNNLDEFLSRKKHNLSQTEESTDGEDETTECEDETTEGEDEFIESSNISKSI